MTFKISKFLRNFSYKTNEINRLLVSTFIYSNNIEVKNNNLIKELLLNGNDTDVYSLSKLVIDAYQEFSIERLIELFEFVISPAEKEVNGAVYTPKNIRDFIVQESLNKFPMKDWKSLMVADISCGCGGFFISVADYIKSHINIEYSEIYRHLYGIDIEEYSIERTKILLTLYAIQNGEDIKDFTFNLFCGLASNNSSVETTKRFASKNSNPVEKAPGVMFTTPRVKSSSKKSV